MKTCGAILMLLCCCVVQTQLRADGISDNAIRTEDINDNDIELTPDDFTGAAQGTEAALTASTQQTCQPDILTVLREMNALLVEQRMELRQTKTQLEALENRLRASESLGDQLKMENKDLRREREQSRVSFSASLITEIGPSPEDTTLVFTDIITNIGNAYSSNTGIFRAPIRGVYFFAVFVYGHGDESIPIGVYIYKNGEHVVLAYAHQPSYNVKPSNGASLLLEEGDEVYVKLFPGARVQDNGNRHSTFSGHLLFPM